MNTPSARPSPALWALVLVSLLGSLLVGVAGQGSPSARTAGSGSAGPTGASAAIGDDLRLAAARSRARDLEQVIKELRTGLRRADRRKPIPPRTRPKLARLKQNKWNGPEECTANPGDTTSAICPLGAQDGDRTVVLFGDSHPNMWIRGLQGPARRAGITLVPLIKFGCTPYEMRMWRFDLGPWEECFTWREWAYDRIAEIQPDVVVTSGHRNFTLSRAGETTPMPEDERDQAFYDGVSKTLRMLQQDADEIVVLADINYLKEDPVRCLKRPRASMRRCESPVTEDTRHHNAILTSAVDDAPSGLFDPPVRFHDPNNLICLDDRCPIVADLTYMYFDFFHVSRDWAKHVGPVLAPEIGIAPRQPGGLLP